MTGAFRRGAEEVRALAERLGATCAILKQRSPSCGTREIYDGTFSGKTLPGMGVTARALKAMGIQLYDEENWREMLKDAEVDDI